MALQALTAVERQSRHQPAIEEQQRPQTTGTLAADSLQPPALAGAVIIDPQSQARLQPIGQLCSAPHHTGGAQADTATMGWGRLQMEEVIEAGDAEDVAERQLQSACHLPQGRGWQVTKLLLHHMQHLNQILTPAAVIADQGRDAGVIGPGDCAIAGSRARPHGGHADGQLLMS